MTAEPPRPTLACIFCEAAPAGPETSAHDWQTEGRFLFEPAADLYELLQAAGVADRGHPDNLSVQVSAEALFEDSELLGQTTLSPAELPPLLAHAPPAQHARLLAWAAFAFALEGQGQAARLIVWFVQ